ncbi:MAG: SURF1 family protein [Pseudomonadota bacterium]
MLRRLLVPISVGLLGSAILVSLGIWQVQRLAWKEALLAQIETQIAAPPVALPIEPDAEADRFLPVEAAGEVLSEAPIRVLHALPRGGPGYRVISAFETDGRRILLDRGFVPNEGEIPNAGAVTVTGNLDWPNEVGSSTPEPDLMRGIWFGRDVAAMAQTLNTEPVLLVAREIRPADTLQPLPVGTEGIPNDHLQYAGTWFSLAIVWLGMTLLFVWRITRRTN